MPSNINILNELRQDIPLSTNVEPALSGSFWGVDATAAPLGLARILWIDRNAGITNGETWIFTTAFSYAGVSVQLQESLTGTFPSSDLKIQITAGGESTGWATAQTVLSFNGRDGKLYEISGTFFQNGEYDDVTYTVLVIE
jgi:phospholipase C